MVRNLVILGSTGSIGRQTLDIVRSMGNYVRVYGLATHRNADLLREQIEEFRPVAVTVGCDVDHEWLTTDAEVLPSPNGMVELVTRPDVDLVVVATAGSGGLLPTLAALRAGKLVALANKEALVMAGSVIRRVLESGNGQLVPIDSEHSAVWQCLQGEPGSTIERLILTASGGALRNLTESELSHVTPEQALQHPTWTMGRKVTIDSANLMNKGLEIMEAQWLFDIPLSRIEVVLHSQSIVHSLVTFHDGSTKAQLGLPDMRLPIQYALSHPDRWQTRFPRLDLTQIGNLTFARVDLDRYPALRVAMDAGKAGGTYPAVLCGADDVAVDAFLRQSLRFTDIPRVVEQTLAAHRCCMSPELDDILDADRWAREEATRLVSLKSVH